MIASSARQIASRTRSARRASTGFSAAADFNGSIKRDTSTAKNDPRQKDYRRNHVPLDTGRLWDKPPGPDAAR